MIEQSNERQADTFLKLRYIAFELQTPTFRVFGAMVNTHSCRYCKKLKVKFPAPKAGRYINKVVLKRIKSAASNGCGFFEWCLSQWKTYLHTLEDTSVLEIWAFMEADDRPGQLRMQWQSDSDIPDIDKMVFMNLVALDSK